MHFAPRYSSGVPLHDDTDLIRSAPGPESGLLIEDGDEDRKEIT